MSEKPAAVTAAQTGQRRSWGARALCAAWLLLAVVLLAAGVWSLWLFVGTDQRAASQARAAVERFDAACSTAGEAGSDSATAAEVVGLLSFPGYDDQSWPVLAGTGAVLLLVALGMGMLISAGAKNQFVACQLAFLSAFMPGMMLSGFVFEISSMPTPIRLATNLVPAKYFVSCLHSLFLVGNVWEILLPNLLFLGVVGLILFTIVAAIVRKRID